MLREHTSCNASNMNKQLLSVPRVIYNGRGTRWVAYRVAGSEAFLYRNFSCFQAAQTLGINGNWLTSRGWNGFCHTIWLFGLYRRGDGSRKGENPCLSLQITPGDSRASSRETVLHQNLFIKPTRLVYWGFFPRGKRDKQTSEWKTWKYLNIITFIVRKKKKIIIAQSTALSFLLAFK